MTTKSLINFFSLVITRKKKKYMFYAFKIIKIYKYLNYYYFNKYMNIYMCALKRILSQQYLYEKKEHC